MRVVQVVCGACQTPVEFVKRTVVTRPGDQHWPQNTELELPFCPACKRLLDTRGTQRVFAA